MKGLGVLVLACLLGGCLGQVDVVRMQYAREYRDCELTAVRVTSIAPNTYLASGCDGRRVYFRCLPSGGVGSAIVCAQREAPISVVVEGGAAPKLGGTPAEVVPTP